MAWLVAADRNSNRRTNETKPVCVPSAKLPSQLLFSSGGRTRVRYRHNGVGPDSERRGPPSGVQRTTPDCVLYRQAGPAGCDTPLSNRYLRGVLSAALRSANRLQISKQGGDQ